MKIPRSLTDKADAIARLGPAWLAYRVRYAAEQKLGVSEKRSPLQDRWIPGPTSWPLPLFDPDHLRSWLNSNYTSERTAELRTQQQGSARRLFDVFGTRLTVDSWSTDAVSGHEYPNDVHWSRVPHLSGVDVKQVWEPSRFAWAYPLARLHLLDPETNAAGTFFDLFESWLEENPPNAGINWDCGQEASIRLFAVVLAANAMSDALSHERLRTLNSFALATAERIAANIAYAKSQNNNHHTSEAAGLIVVGALFPHLEQGEDFLDLGLVELADACERLVMADGATSQYSANYHRAFCHGIGIAVASLVAANSAVPYEISSALTRATEFTDALCTRPEGTFPVFGENDGANILPLSSCDHYDMRPTLVMCEAIANNRTVLDAGPWDEALHWLGIQPTRHVAQGKRPPIRSYPDGGVHILSAGDFTVFLLARQYQFRPPQADQLHVDIWWRGQPLAADGGTASYNPGSAEIPQLGDSRMHNTITRGGENHMPRVSRFLFSHWQDAFVTTKSIDGVQIAVATMGDMHRTVQVEADAVHIFDSSESDAAVTTIFIDPERFAASPEGATEMVPINYGAQLDSPQLWRSRVRISAPLPATTEILIRDDEPQLRLS